jgi:hypothetical protein
VAEEVHGDALRMGGDAAGAKAIAVITLLVRLAKQFNLILATNPTADLSGEHKRLLTASHLFGKAPMPPVRCGTIRIALERES